MKMNPLLKALNLFAFVVITSLTVIGTTAQATIKPAYVSGDTTERAKNIDSFEVRLIVNEDEQNFILAVTNPSAEKLRIRIAGPDGVDFVDQTKASFYPKRINMSEAQDGNYILTITGEKKSYTKTITLNTAIVQTRSLNMQ